MVLFSAYLVLTEMYGEALSADETYLHIPLYLTLEYDCRYICGESTDELVPGWFQRTQNQPMELVNRMFGDAT